MLLSAGDKLGPYEILALIGAGGMGEVYRARDTRLGREVAIKLSKSQFSERFEREARTVAALNHPNICQLYDVGPNYLVMELIDGQPLKGPLPLDAALEYASQICDALEAAHKKGITHRDLKPANILVMRSGIKLLDFGLAQAAQASPSDTNATETITLTSENTILGTVPYMAPEQLEGKEADARSDIFALGALLYEMITGKRAFEGASRASVMAAILERDPPSVAPVAAPVLDRVLRRCVEKDPDERWQSARDVRSALEFVPEPPTSVQSARGRPLPWIFAALFAVFAMIGLWSPWRGGSRTAGGLARFNIYPPEGAVFTGAANTTVAVPQFALSPDGHAIVFAAAAVGAGPMLWLRPIDEVTPHLLPGTEGAFQPIWSPDGRWVSFFAEGKLKKTPASGGAVRVIAEGVADPRGSSWGRDDVILFAAGNRPILRVPAGGGPVTSVTSLDSSRQEAHRWPQLLPDGNHFLYTIRGGDRSGLFAGSLDGKTKKFLVRSYSSAAYTAPGCLLWLDGDTLLTQAFDANHLELNGQLSTVAERVGRTTAGDVAVSASPAGALAYAGAMLRRSRLTWFERSGHALESLGPEGDYPDFRLSPDDTRLAASLIDPKTNYPDIWLTDLTRGSTSRVTFGPMINASPVWSPDGAQLIYRTNPKGRIEFYKKSAFGGGNEAPVLPTEAQQAAGMHAMTLIPTDWSPDGRYIIYSVSDVASGYDLWLFPLAGDGKPVRLLGSASDELHANFSPDGRLVAYSSNEREISSVRPNLSAIRPEMAGLDQRWIGTKVAGRWRRDLLSL